MNILQYSPAYRPNVGGLEFIVHTLAREFVELGHNSRILTPQPGTCRDDVELGVIRRPSLRQQLTALRWADAVICHQDVLKLAWVLASTKKPALMMINVSPQRRRWPASWLMRRIIQRCDMYASSRHLAREVSERFSVHCGVLPNPYDAKNFYPPSDRNKRTIDLVFVGRLAFVKGVDVFVESLAELARCGLRPSVAIIGGGEDCSKIEGLIGLHGLGSHVDMRGPLSGEQIADVLRNAYCMVVPSRYEPFGIVALEGRACGCRLVTTDAGGLPEAAGEEALIVRHSSAQALSSTLKKVLEERRLADEKSSNPPADDGCLKRYEPWNVALSYLSVLGAAKLT